MAKSTRSNCKKQLRTWRREKLVAKWQSDADAKRYAALQAIAEQPKPEPAPKATSDDDVAMAEQRGRSGKAAKEKDVNMATDAQEGKGEGKGKKGRKGTKVGVNKKRKAGKLFFKAGEFHGKKGSKKRPGRT